MIWALLWCLLVVQSVCGDYNSVADINGVHTENSGKAQVEKNTGDGFVKIRHDGNAMSSFDGNQMNSFSADQIHTKKPINSNPNTFNGQLENQKINVLLNTQTKDQKFLKSNKSKQEIQKSMDHLKKKSKSEKKYGRVTDKSNIVEKNSQNIPIQLTREITGNKPNEQLVKEINGKRGSTIKGYSTKKQEEKPPKKEPVTLKGSDIDETENLIDDTEDDYDSEMKRLKKNLLFENMIPKSNKFLYNNKKYHEHLMDEREAIKHDKEYKLDSADIHHRKRNRRSVLSSIFVQMPHEDDESDSIDDDYRYAMDEESRDKKSKGSTTVCLEIKSDPTKPPSTICGPEIKPNTPLEPHMYDMASNQQYIPSNDYYTEPGDKTIWSLNPLHDPNYYSGLSNYKYQSTNRENHHQLNKINNGNKEYLDKNKMTTSSQVTTQDNGGYQTKKLSMNTISHNDKSEQTLKTMPQASNNVDQEKNQGKTRLGQTPRNFLLENIQDNSNIPRNYNFKDLDLNLDGEMSTNTNSYANPSGFQETQFDPILNAEQNGDTTRHGFKSDPDTFYPSTAFADSVGIWRGNEQPFQDDMQLAMSYDQLYGLQMNGETPQRFVDPSLEDAKHVEQSELRENNLNTDETNIPDESAPRSAYEYYPDRGYPYRPNTYPYVPHRPSYPYRPRPYIYDRYDPDCRSGRCRSAEPWAGTQNIVDMAENIVGSPLATGARDALGFLSGLDQFKGDAYYSGRPYPYRPHEYQGSYPYASQPYYGASYPYRPSYSGSTYPYDSNCRTAEGRSCRESEEGKNADVNISPSVAEPNYALPNMPMSPSWAEKNPRNKNPSFDGSLLGSLKPLPLTPSHVPVGLACNMIHAPVIPPHLVHPVTPVGINPVIGTHGIGLNGLGHLYGGGLTSGIGSHGINSGIGTHSLSFNTGFTTNGLKGLSLKDSHQSFVDVLSGVGSHGVGGSHGLVNHHLLGEKYQLSKETEDREESSSKQSNDSVIPSLVLGKASERTDTKTKTTPSVEELKSKIAEKLKAAEDKLKSSKSAILEKINNNIEKEKKIEDDDNGSDIGEKSTDAETKSTFFSPSVVPYPQGGGMSYNSEGRNLGSGIIPFLTGSPNGSPLINLQTPLGGTLTYDSPIFRYGILNRGFLGAPSPFQSGSQNFQSGSSYQTGLPQCTCQPGSTQCICPGTSGMNGNAYAYAMNRNSQANLESAPLIYERTIVNPSAVFKSQYSSEKEPILGLNWQEKSTYNSAASESKGTIESEQIKTPCMINKENQMRSSVNENVENVQLAQQPIIQPIITPVFVPQAPVLGAPAPMEVSFRAPSYEPVSFRAPSYEPASFRAPLYYEPSQYDMNGMPEGGLQNQMYEYQPSPFVGFASLSEMKERNNQLKENYIGYENNYNQLNQQLIEDQKPNYNAYEDIYKESMMKQAAPCDPSEKSFKNSEESEIKTSNVKITKKPTLTELGKIPSKILTAKPFKLPAPILKLAKPNLKGLAQKEPCP